MPIRLMHDVLKLAGRMPRADDDVRFSGGDPVFPTPFAIGSAGAAALGAIGVAASDLWRLRSGRGQSVAVDLRAAAASLRSNTYVLRDGRKPVSWDPLAGHYATADGRHMFLHTNHPHHRAGALRVSGAKSEDRAGLAAAVAEWKGQDIEDAIAAAGMVGGLTRTQAEWAAHPHGQAVSTLPLFEIVKIGEAPPQKLPAGDRPLAGIRVLDLTRVLAGPTCGRVLAENGAEILHIAAEHLPYQTDLLMDTGHGKRGAYLDLRDAANVETLKALVRGAHVFSQGYRPGTLAARGFSPEALAALRPGIVCLSLCAYSHAGPWADRRGFDSIVQNVTGMAVAGSSLEKPRNMPVQANDYIAGYIGALGVMLALHRRATEGGSWLVRLSLVQVAHWIGGLGTLDASNARAELADDEIAAITMESDGPFGRLRHLKPVVQLSETPCFYARPAEPLGSSRPEWL
ncbi:MAG: CoA transferase [Alphaproteobacteria bacterium]|nr:CoA transferase [Alphaproteobacteria bacterium]MCW5744472.1 CoA transferase [Alphaproteobacteria bacterium]